MKSINLSLRTKLTAVLFLASAIIIIVTISVMMALLLNRVSAELDNRLHQGADGALERISDLKESAEERVKLSQSLPDVVQIAEGKVKDRADAASRIQRLARYTDVNFALIADSSGLVLASSPDQTLVGKNISDIESGSLTSLQHDALRGLVESNIYAASGSDAIYKSTADAPIRNESHSTVGILYEGFNLDSSAIQDFVSSQNHDAVTLYDLSDAKKPGGVLTSTIRDQKKGQYNRSLPAAALEIVKKNKTQIIQTDFAGVSYRMEVLPLTNSGGTVVGALSYGLDINSAQASNLNIILIVLAVVIAALVGFLFLIIFIVKNVTRTIDQLVAASERVAAGDFTPRVPVMEEDEIGKLSRTFNIMTVQLSEYYGQLEAKVQSKTDELRASQGKELQRAAELSRLKDEFVYIAVHELRAPVTAIKGYMYLVLDKKIGKPSTELIDMLRHVDDAGRHLSSLIDDLIEISRAEAGQLSLHLGPQDLGQIIEKVVQEQTGSAQQKGLALTYQASAGLPLVLGDKDKLAEVFTNLVSNAIKYTPNGSVTITHDLQEDRLLTRISDTGLGISREDQAHLFEKFFRVKNDKTMSISGTGLGLFIVKILIEKMSGKIAVESEVDKGSNFIISLQMTHERPVASHSTGFELAGAEGASVSEAPVPPAPLPEPSPVLPVAAPVAASELPPETQSSSAPAPKVRTPFLSLDRKDKK